MKLNVEQYKAFLEELAKSKKVELAEMKKKMANCGSPGVTSGASGVRIKSVYLIFTFHSPLHTPEKKWVRMIMSEKWRANKI